MSKMTDRFHERKVRVAAAADMPRLYLAPAPAVIMSGLGKGVDVEFLSTLKFAHEPADLDATAVEVDQLLSRISSEMGQRRINQLLDECKASVIQSIAGPFGLGQLSARMDVTGGPVDTIHNNRAGHFATDEVRERYESRPRYDHKRKAEFHQHGNYTGANDQISKQFKGDGPGVADTFSRQTFKQSKGHKVGLDHHYSASDSNDDAGIYTAGLDPVDMANRPANLGPTSKTTNSSKGRKSPGEFAQWLRDTKEQRQKDIAKLEKVANPTDKQANELRKLRELEMVDLNKLEHADRTAKKDRDDFLNDTYYKGEDFKRKVKETSLREATAMAKQQAFGALLAEFFLGLINEIQDWNASGRKKLMLGERLKRVIAGVAKRWKHVLAMGFQGALTGFLSNLATIFINVFVTTEKRLIRMIREGLMSLVRAMSTLVFRPEGVTFKEAAHAATKLAFAGGVVIGGVILEEAVIQALNSMGLGFIAGFATAIIVGSITGIAAGLVAFGLDKLDLFGVEAEARHGRVVSLLETSIEDAEAVCDSLLLELHEYQLPLLA